MEIATSIILIIQSQILRHVHAAVVRLDVARPPEGVVDHAVVLAWVAMLLLHLELITVETQVAGQVRCYNFFIALAGGIVKSMLLVGHRGATRQVFLACNTSKIIIGALLHIDFILLLIFILALDFLCVYGTLEVLWY